MKKLRLLRRLHPLLLLLIIPIVFLIVGYRSVPPHTRTVESLVGRSGFPTNLARFLAENEDQRTEWMEKARAFPARPLAIPLPAEYSGTNTGGRLVFAQVADGPTGSLNRFMQTAFTLVNDCGYPATGKLEFFDDAGKPLTLTIGGVSASSFNISLAHGETKTLTTAGTGSLKVGWARLSSDQPLAGTCSFSIRNPAGDVFADVGVDESLFAKKFMLFADTKGDADTGVALVNPDKAAPLNLHLELMNTSGAKIASTDFSLPAGGHRARFISELFSTVAGILEYEGSLIITSDRPFGGITLRTVGQLMTSVPMVLEPRLDQPRDELVFPQIANGQAGGMKCVSSIVLFNASGKPAQATVDFFKSDGSPFSVTIGGVTKSSFAFGLNTLGVRRLTTNGAGALVAGWAKVTMDRTLSGAVIYQIFNQPGPLISEVGVEPGSTLTTLNAVANSQGKVRTGIALVWAPDSSSSSSTVTLDLLDGKGVSVKQKKVTLQRLEHQALFLDELFNDVANITAFQGRLRVSGSSGLAILTLRQCGPLTTSVPTLAPQYGFVPVSVLEFPQTLTGTAPPVRWRVLLPGMDLALNTIKVEAAALGLNVTGIQAGDELGYGSYLLTVGTMLSYGGVVKLIATGTGSILFDIIASGPGVPTGGVLMSGKLSGQATSGLILELGPTNAKNADSNTGIELQLDITLRPGLIKAPAAAGKAQIKTTYVSGSAKASEDGVAVVRVSTQNTTFTAPTGGSPTVTGLKPAFFSPGSRLFLYGSNFGTSPVVYFRGSDGKDSWTWIDEIKPDSIKVFVPGNAVDGPIKVMNGATAANAFQARTLFSPAATLTKTAITGGFSLDCKIDQLANQLALASFELRLFNVAWKTGLTVDSKIGTMKITGSVGSTASTTYDVKVESVTADKITLGVPEQDETDPVWRIELSKEGAGATVIMAVKPVTGSDLPVVYGLAGVLQLSLPNLGLSQVSSSYSMSWTGTFVSAPSDLFGAETGLSVDQEMTVLQ